MIAEVLKRKNLYKACRQVVQNKGSAGINGMTVRELPEHLEANRDRIITSVLNHTYVPDAILAVEIPKGQREDPIAGNSDSNRPMAPTGGKPGAGHKVRVGH